MASPAINMGLFDGASAPRRKAGPMDPTALAADSVRPDSGATSRTPPLARSNPSAPSLDGGIVTSAAPLLADRTARTLSDTDDSAPNMSMPRAQRIITAFLLLAPLAGVAVAIVLLFGKDFTLVDLALGVGLYVISGHGVTAGYHRMFAHRGFTATRGRRSSWRSLGARLRGCPDQLGGEPPSTPRLHRRIGRPALAAPRRARPLVAHPRGVARPCRLAVPRRRQRRRTVGPRSARRP